MRNLNIDSQGKEIRPGQKVAYNLSGQVVPGVVKEIVPGIYEKDGWPRLKGGCIKVECQSQHKWHTAGKISKVTDG